jgi:hypothetical protein
MLSSISPLGERARNSRWWLTTAAYLVGSVVGGLALGTLAALVGSALPESWRASPWALTLVAASFVVGVLVNARSGGHGVPSWRRQVDVRWLDAYRGWVMGLGFGAQLGFGVVTIVTSTTTYAAVLLAALSGNVGVGLVLGGVFGLVRALPAVLMAGVHDAVALHRVFARLDGWAKPVDLVANVSLAGAAAALAAAALTATTLTATALGS